MYPCLENYDNLFLAVVSRRCTHIIYFISELYNRSSIFLILWPTPTIQFSVRRLQTMSYEYWYGLRVVHNVRIKNDRYDPVLFDEDARKLNQKGSRMRRRYYAVLLQWLPRFFVVSPALRAYISPSSSLSTIPDKILVCVQQCNKNNLLSCTYRITRLYNPYTAVRCSTKQGKAKSARISDRIYRVQQYTAALIQRTSDEVFFFYRALGCKLIEINNVCTHTVTCQYKRPPTHSTADTRTAFFWAESISPGTRHALGRCSSSGERGRANR